MVALVGEAKVAITSDGQERVVEYVVAFRHYLEYYGIFARLVMTPLTERCKRTMIAPGLFFVVGEAGWGN